MQQSPTHVMPVAAGDRPSRRRRRGLLVALLGLTTISLGAGMFSLAIFTDTDSSTGSFTAGTIDIESSPSVAFTVTSMVPGDVETAALTIDNDGTADLRYAMTSVASNTPGDTLTLTVREEGWFDQARLEPEVPGYPLDRVHLPASCGEIGTIGDGADRHDPCEDRRDPRHDG